jgi:hypothetical protein
MSGSNKPPTQRMFTIVELDDMGVPENPDAIVHSEVIDTTNRWRNTVECIFRVPDTDEHYRFYYHTAKAGQRDLAWYDDFADGTVPCTRVVLVAAVVHQWRSVDQQDTAPYTWPGVPGRRTARGQALPLLHDGQPVGDLLLTDTETEHLVRVLGGQPRRRKAATGLLKAADAAEALNMTVAAINHLRVKGRIPFERQPGGLYYYDPDAVRAAIDAEQHGQISLDDQP